MNRPCAPRLAPRSQIAHQTVNFQGTHAGQLIATQLLDYKGFSPTKARFGMCAELVMRKSCG